MKKGQIDILNVGDGHTEIVIDQSSPVEVVRAERIITDMLKRGYVLFVHGTDNALIRVEKWDPKQKAYVIADGPTVPPEAVPYPPEPKDGDLPPVTLKRGRQKMIKPAETKTTVVGRSAGG